jgi:hypothetical protein
LALRLEAEPRGALLLGRDPVVATNSARRAHPRRRVAAEAILARISLKPSDCSKRQKARVFNGHG